MKHSVLLLLAFALLTGCEPEVLTEPAAPSLEATAATFDGVPAAFSRSPYIQEVRNDAGFDGPEAFSIGSVRYWANRARLTVKLFVREGYTSVGNRDMVREATNFFPAYRRISTAVSMLVDASCGHTAEGYSDATVWHQFLLKLSLLSWGHASASDQKLTRQPSCRGGCDTRFIMDPEEEENCSGGSSSGRGSEGGEEDEGPSDNEIAGLDCHTEYVFIWGEDGLIYQGEAEVCE